MKNQSSSTIAATFLSMKTLLNMETDKKPFSNKLTGYS